jgi:hypothetical protein
MCGFRVYPLPPTLALIDSVKLGKRMDFDPTSWCAWPGATSRCAGCRPGCTTRRTASHFACARQRADLEDAHPLFFGMLLRAR